MRKPNNCVFCHVLRTLTRYKPYIDPGRAQVGEGERGYLLELLLTKLRYAAVSPDPEAKPDAAHEGLQIIGMSATMPNVSAVAQWLGAQLFQTSFRSGLYISMCVYLLS